MKKFIAMLTIGVMLLTLCASCGSKKQSNNEENTPSPSPVAEGQDEENKEAETIGFTIELENGDVMKGELYPDVAPETVENFVKLANENFYEGLIFHRVIPGFMIQGGGMDKDFNPKEADSIKGEFTSNGFKNDLKHTRGVISMARTSVPDSASSQFFIMHEDYPSLDGQYAAFGKITEGLDVVDKIAETKTTTVAELGMQDVPVEPIVIKSITINK